MTANANINIRTSPERKAVIDRAARILGRNRSEFVLEAAEERAREVLMDQTQLELDARQFKKFIDLLDQPLPPDSQAALKRLLERRAPWET